MERKAGAYTLHTFNTETILACPLSGLTCKCVCKFHDIFPTRILDFMWSFSYYVSRQYSLLGSGVQCHGHANPNQHTTGWMQILRGHAPKPLKPVVIMLMVGLEAFLLPSMSWIWSWMRGGTPAPCHPLWSYMWGLGGGGPRRAYPYFEIGTARISKKTFI